MGTQFLRSNMVYLPRTFRARMAWLFGCLVLAVGLPSYLYISHVYADRLLGDREQVLQGLAVSAATVLSENLAERRREIDLLAQSDTFRSAPLDGPAIQRSLERLQKSHPHYSWIGLTNAQGVVRSATQHHLSGVDVSQRPWFVRGQQASYVGDVHEAVLLARLLAPDPGGQPLRFIDFASPVTGLDGRLRGVLGAHAHWRWAGQVLAAATPANAQAQGVDVLIVNHQNQVIFPDRLGQAEMVPAGVPQSPNRTPVFVSWGGAERFLTVSASVVEPLVPGMLGWRVVVRQPADFVTAGVKDLQRGVLLVSLVAGALLLMLVWVGAGRMARPVEHLTAVARQVEQGTHTVVFDVRTGSQELKHLAQALQAMARTLLEHQHALEDHNRLLETHVAERTAELTRANRALERLARTDNLTGLPNRHVANEHLRQVHAAFQRSRQAVSVLVVDVDHFKRVNDNHGHAAGDAVLCQVAHTLQQQVRATDTLARVGGEEFLVILPHTPLAVAATVADKWRRAVEATPVLGVGTVTISVGVAEMVKTDATPEATVNRADRCLYAAKRLGRNQVATAS